MSDIPSFKEKLQIQKKVVLFEKTVTLYIYFKFVA